ncbi:MAG: hypothetical protein DME55_05725 [Verrucomicrobia bacterium]|nr:MAG: hypothetical protein DME55_05725 [Verrucomicrobiota bacterium]
MGGDGSCYISKQVKAETAALGFRVKSGWAAVVLFTGPVGSPVLRDNRMIDLSDPQFPDTRQPHHATFGQLETDAKKINRRTDIVHRVTKQSVTKLLAEHQRKGYAITHASLVVGSQLDPATIANPHVRAHALEGELFRSALEQALNAHKIRTAILLERDAFANAAVELEKSTDDVRRMIEELGRFTDAPWRVDQKLAALGAWLALRHKPALGKRGER